MRGKIVLHNSTFPGKENETLFSSISVYIKYKTAKFVNIHHQIIKNNYLKKKKNEILKTKFKNYKRCFTDIKIYKVVKIELRSISFGISEFPPKYKL